MNRPFADEVNYFKTSQTAPDTWIAKTKKEIQSIGGVVTSEVQGTINSKAAVMLTFRLGEDAYKIVYEVLPVREEKDELAAKRQACTAMYHEVKALCVSAKFRSVRAAFNSYLLLPDHRTVAEHSDAELLESLPTIFRLPVPKEST